MHRRAAGGEARDGGPESLSARSHTLELNGIELHFDTSGAGEPLVLLHGMGGSAGDWRHAGRESLDRAYRTIAVDARGHGRSSNALSEITHGQCARDLLALLDALEVPRCRAIGVSMGGNVLLHAVALAPERIAAMVLVSAVACYGEEARSIMRGVSDARETHSDAEWAEMRARHAHGDEQIRAIWRAMRALADDASDMAFTRESLARVGTRTLVVQGDHDPLIPVERGVELFRALPRAALWVVPGGGHGPIFLQQAEPFVRQALAFLRESD